MNTKARVTIFDADKMDADEREYKIAFLELVTITQRCCLQRATTMPAGLLVDIYANGPTEKD